MSHAIKCLILLAVVALFFITELIPLAITATAGVSCSRIAYYTTRTLKAFFEDMSKDTDPYFKPAMYVSVGMKYKF